MNKRGIDFTPSFLFGLILGIIFLIIGILFLRSIYSGAKETVEKDPIQELKGKITSLEDGEDSFMTYKILMSF